MRFVKTLWHSLKNLLRKPNAIRKFIVFVLVVLAFWVMSHMLAGRVAENMLVSACLRWLWIPLSVLFLIIRYGEIKRRREVRRFFLDIKFFGIDGMIPVYERTDTINQYLEMIRFKSKVHKTQWEKIIPSLEIFFEKKVYRIENPQNDMKITDVYLIKERLPNFILWSDDYVVDGRRFVIGEGYNGKVVWNATNTSHSLLGGSTNGGKSSLLRCIAHQAILKGFNINVFDFKNGGDFACIENEYRKNRLHENGRDSIVISEPDEARRALSELITTVKGRLKLFKEAGVTNIDEFNSLEGEQLIPWLVIIDEAAEILGVTSKDSAVKSLYLEIDQSLRTLARISRASGLHIVCCVIRPSSDILDGSIKNCLSWRGCFYYPDPAASRIVLDNDRATELPPDVKGRLIVADGADCEEVQAYYLPILKPNTTNNTTEE